MAEQQTRERQASSWLAIVIPFFVLNGACAACSGIPAALAFLPASLVGSPLAFVGSYGMSAVLAIFVLIVIMAYSLYKADEYRGRVGV